jgi:hypothetical protein
VESGFPPGFAPASGIACRCSSVSCWSRCSSGSRKNIGTWSRAWLHPSQAEDWSPVSLTKLGSWYLLMIISFVLVTLVHRPKLMHEPSKDQGRF